MTKRKKIKCPNGCYRTNIGENDVMYTGIKPYYDHYQYCPHCGEMLNIEEYEVGEFNWGYEVPDLNDYPDDLTMPQCLRLAYWKAKEE